MHTYAYICSAANKLATRILPHAPYIGAGRGFGRGSAPPQPPPGMRPPPHMGGMPGGPPGGFGMGGDGGSMGGSAFGGGAGGWNNAAFQDAPFEDPAILNMGSVPMAAAQQQREAQLRVVHEQQRLQQQQVCI